ncbi:MAG: UDP-N-acetylmuramate--L-alanine ligase [Patescibacteria group bacterium]|nr:UDP-N-acetylmuramate--L-alanine ligase [Patescibacteria group bacterium]MDD4611331.1 UDP-N-acetylmuramate--L-alanine ligase [Patescibacteria group bacterium]
MDLSKIKKIYMIGIKGVGMTMLAQFLREKNYEVLGSDTSEKYMTDEILKKAGIKVIEGFNEENIPPGADLIIYSTAYKEENNIEIKKSLTGKIKVLKYAEALAEIFNQHYGVAVVGSHGKTTTTAWLGYVLTKSGFKPSVMVGSAVPQFGGASLAGQSAYLVVELDEYQNKLQYFQPKMVLLNNIDWDHPDFFPTPDDYAQAFVKFIEKIPKKGFLIANFDDPIISKIANVNCRGRVVSYGLIEPKSKNLLLRAKASESYLDVLGPSFSLGGAALAAHPETKVPKPGLKAGTGDYPDYLAYDIKSNNGKIYFKVRFTTKEAKLPIGSSASETFDELGEFCISLSGKHNVYNALAVIAAAIELGVNLVDIRTYLEEFTGTARRMQLLGEFQGAKIYDDYAHHPTEIKATLQGARELFGDKKITVVFHPHTFTRTKAYLEDFAKSFGDADEVIVLDIYGSAREKQGGVSSEDLVEKIKQETKNKKKEIKYIPTLDEAEKYLRENANRGDVVILMGAGDVFRIGENLLKF